MTAAGVISDINVATGTGTITSLVMNTNNANTVAIQQDVAGTKLVISSLIATANAAAAVTLTGTTAAKLEIGTIALGAATGGKLTGTAAFTLKGNVTVGNLGQFGSAAAAGVANMAVTVDRTAARTIAKGAAVTSLINVTLTGVTATSGTIGDATNGLILTNAANSTINIGTADSGAAAATVTVPITSGNATIL